MATRAQQQAAKFIGPPLPPSGWSGYIGALEGVATPGKNYRVGQIVTILMQGATRFGEYQITTINETGGVLSCRQITAPAALQEPSIATYPARSFRGSGCTLTFSFTFHPGTN